MAWECGGVAEQGVACATWIDAHPPEDGLARAHKRPQTIESELSLTPAESLSLYLTSSDGTSENRSETVHAQFGRHRRPALAPPPMQSTANGDDRDGAEAGSPVGKDEF